MPFSPRGGSGGSGGGGGGGGGRAGDLKATATATATVTPTVSEEPIFSAALADIAGMRGPIPGPMCSPASRLTPFAT